MIIKDYLQMALDKKASDIILSAKARPVLKIRGEVSYIEGTEFISKEEMQALVFSTMNEEQRKRFVAEKEFDYGIWFWKYRFRVNTFMTRNGMAMVCRPIATEVPQFEKLGLPLAVKGFAEKTNGLVLITWSVGSGKSTSMLSLLNEINEHQAKHIITVEDPIEYVFENKKSLIEQREVENSTLSFENWLKYALRQAPDVIMVGEMRDIDTFRLALRAAETGNLVFATLHTSGAARTVSRVIDMFPAGEKEQVKAQLSESLIGVVWQKLLKTADWKGRVLAAEVMVNNTSISNIIRKGETHQIDSVIETSARDWMINMRRTLDTLYEEWKISEKTHEFELDLLGRDL